MSEKFIVLLKKSCPYLLFLTVIVIFLFLSEAPGADAETPYIAHSLMIESYPEETETETEPLPTETEPEPTEPPESVLLEDVPYYSQEHLLPTGCEIVSAKMLLEYYTKEEVNLDNLIALLHCQSLKEIDGHLCGSHPEDAFIGTPKDDSGFGCFAPVIVEAMNQLLPEGYQAVDISGFDLQEIAETYLPQGKPVLIWATINLWEPSQYFGWYLTDENGKLTDEWYDWLANEHCMVLVGYDADYYYFNDPYDSHGLISFRREKTEKRFEQIGKYAAVVTEKNEKP